MEIIAKARSGQEYYADDPMDEKSDEELKAAVCEMFIILAHRSNMPLEDVMISCYNGLLMDSRAAQDFTDLLNSL